MPSMLQDPPEVDAAAAVGILRDRYRIDAEVRPLRSERARNFLAVGRDAQQLVLKVSNSGDDPTEIAMESAAMRHVGLADPTFPTPRLLAAAGGESTITVGIRGWPRRCGRSAA